jgi:prepilin-type N-terminal cleavage/methylation domain-containing protein/prepilin-type processing-associated H-X9-DG protein
MRVRGFTLIELLVVVGIIGLLVSMMLPALSRARESSKATVCLSNMRQMSLGTVMYAQCNHDTLPSVGMSHGSHTVDEQGSWFRQLQKYCKVDDIYRCPCDRSPWWDQPLPGGTRVRKVSFATNYYVSGKYEEPTGEYRQFNRLSRIPRPAAVIFAVELAEGNDRALGSDHWEFGAADHVHPDEWLIDPVNKPREQMALDRHSGQANYTFLDGSAAKLPFLKTYELNPASKPGKLRWQANKYDPKVAQ